MKFALPTSDIAFKKLFADSKHKDVLMSFLNAVLDRTGEREIVDVTIMDSNNQPELIDLKQTILDVRCTDQMGHNYIVEMQRKNYNDFMERSLFYSAQVYSRQLKSTENYSELMPVIFLGILNFNIFNGKSPVSHHLILNTETYEQEIKHQEFHFIELTKFFKKEHELETIVDKWLYLLQNAGDFDEVPKSLKNPEELGEALDILSTHLWSLKELERYDRELDRARVERSIIETEREAAIKAKEAFIKDKEAFIKAKEAFIKETQEAIIKAKEDAIKATIEASSAERKAIAKNMQAKGLDAEIIAAVTGLSIDQIKALK
jgi:predicted transposase/invertase (TIGR01784 family)